MKQNNSTRNTAHMMQDWIRKRSSAAFLPPTLRETTRLSTVILMNMAAYITGIPTGIQLSTASRPVLKNAVVLQAQSW